MNNRNYFIAIILCLVSHGLASQQRLTQRIRAAQMGCVASTGLCAGALMHKRKFLAAGAACAAFCSAGLWFYYYKQAQAPENQPSQETEDDRRFKRQKQELETMRARIDTFCQRLNDCNTRAAVDGWLERAAVTEFKQQFYTDLAALVAGWNNGPELRSRIDTLLPNVDEIIKDKAIERKRALAPRQDRQDARPRPEHARQPRRGVDHAAMNEHFRNRRARDRWDIYRDLNGDVDE